jgi:serine/alanine adding enzyme
VTVLLDLPDDAETLWKDTFRSKLRSQIRRPMKEGMEVRFGADQVEPFYDVFCARMRDLGTPVLPRSLFEESARHFGTDVAVGVVYHEGHPAASGFGFFHRDEFEMTWAASRPEADRLAPNMLLYWSFMRHAIERRARVFNFGRCTPGEGTHRFKKQWGGADAPLPWLHWSALPQDDGTRPDGPLVRAATSAWQRLPLFVANRAGPVLARRLPF